MNLGDLEKKLEQQVKQDTEQIQTLSQEKLSEFQDNLNKMCKNAETSMQTAMEQGLKQYQKTLNKMVYLPALLIMSLCLSTFIASYPITVSLTNQLNQIRQQKKTLQLLNEKTWGVQLYQTQEGKFIILPHNTQIQTDWKCQGKPCLKL